eukprot:8475404-Lingulodinium_polyedra.AAC.1
MHPASDNEHDGPPDSESQLSEDFSDQALGDLGAGLDGAEGSNVPGTNVAAHDEQERRGDPE